MQHDPMRAVHHAVRRAARTGDAPLLLAVSGGLDSMVLLHAMAGVARARIAAVATMDHGTGAAAEAAVAHVARRAASLGLRCVTERLAPVGDAGDAGDGYEAAWRRERYRFLRDTASRLGGARVVTAHTEDDQLETVLMRVLRGSGARGLAALYAPSEVMRPFLHLRRAALAAYAAAAGVAWREDPSNRSPAHLRNRVRRDLLPALRRADPTLDATLLSLARRAAEWRAAVESVVDERVHPVHRGADTLDVGAAELAGYDADSLAVLWGSLAGRVGLALDRRGTRRLAEFTSSCAADGSIPLSGGWCVEAHGDRYVLRRSSGEPGGPAALPERGELRWGGFSFRVAEARPRGLGASWTAALPAAVPATVRAWSAGDRLGPVQGGARRRVRRYLSDAGVHGLDRAGWPVVTTAGNDDVVWIPGVRRSDAATERSGRPVRYYVCERIDR